MGTRAWLIALLALTLACEGSIETPDGIDRQGAPNVGTDAGTDADAGTDTDAGTDAGTDTDTGTGGSPGQCAGGPLAAPIPNCNPGPAPSSGDIHADCVARINQFRWECQCLPPLARWVDGEACTDSNAEYDSLNGVHASFSAMPCSGGARAQNECPNWSSNDQVITGCLQAMWDEGPEDGDSNTVNGHYESMASTSYTQVACGFFTTPTSKVWGVQNFD